MSQGWSPPQPSLDIELKSVSSPCCYISSELRITNQVNESSYAFQEKK